MANLKKRMPAFYKIDKERRLVMTAASGVLSLADALSHLERLSKDPDFDPSYTQIADFMQVTKIELSAQNIHDLAQRSIFSPQSRRPFIVPSDVAYGLARMFEILRENKAKRELPFFAP